eukprot:SAG22_NODE_286_length_12969_cov_6.982828_7_plen_198_part_00
MAVNLADTASLLAEVTNVFHTDEDARLAEKVVDTRSAIEKTCTEKQEEIKQIIREYTVGVQGRETEASYDGGSIEAEKRTLKDEKSAVIESMQRMEDAQQGLQAQCSDVRNQASEVTAALGGMVEQRDVTIPDMDTKIRLYQLATDIKWDSSSPSVAGYVVSAATETAPARTATFDIPDDGSKSKIEIADEIWALMG